MNFSIQTAVTSFELSAVHVHFEKPPGLAGSQGEQEAVRTDVGQSSKHVSCFGSLWNKSVT